MQRAAAVRNQCGNGKMQRGSLRRFMRMRVSRSLCAAAVALLASAAAAPPPPLPRLDIIGPASASGISSGADLAPMLHIAYSDVFFASGAFAGQAYGCAVHAFDGEPREACAAQPASQRGPGCVGLASTGAAPCEGCGAAGTTVAYDHCKKTPAIIQVARLQRWAEAAAARGDIAPLARLREARVYTYRGTRDSVYLPGCVNQTGAFFAPYVAQPQRQILFEAGVPSQHSQPSIDPAVPRDSCGNYTIGGMQNCGYDGVGAMLQHFYDNALSAPPAGATADPARLLNFSQDAYGNASAQFGGLATTGFAYIPARCAPGAAQPCRVHVALHGCGQSYVTPRQGLLYPLLGGYAPWADANGFVMLFVQGGGFAERGWSTPAAQVMAACHDAYGQTGAAFAWRGGAVLSAIRAMLVALGGEGFWLRR